MNLNLEMKRLHPMAAIPEYKTDGAAAFDLAACLPGGPVEIPPGATYMCPTGIAIHVRHPALALFLWPRSSMDAKNEIGLGAGLVDSDYQGELKVVLINRGSAPFEIAHGDRIAQGVIGPKLTATFVVVDEFTSTTERGVAGFGSTGR